MESSCTIVPVTDHVQDDITSKAKPSKFSLYKNIEQFNENVFWDWNEAQDTHLPQVSDRNV